jgi:4'-phosphopantetheinyl transferase EntD
VTPAIVERTVARRGVAAVLTANERATFEALLVERRRRDWLAGRLAAKRAIRAACRAYGEAPPPFSAIEVWNEIDGAPRFSVAARDDIAERFNLSIAHTNGTAVATVVETAASGTVGVDIEAMMPLALALVKRVLTDAELTRLDTAETRPSPLVMWTAKEAALKAAHRFCRSLSDVELSWNGDGTFGARVMGERVPAHTIVVRHESVGPYTVAVALCQ